MSKKASIAKRRERLQIYLQDGLPVSRICTLLDVTHQTLYQDWCAIQQEWMEKGITDEIIPPHETYRLAVCTKIDLLSRLKYSQQYIGESFYMSPISQSHISKLKVWSETNGLYSDTGIRISVMGGVRSVDGKHEVEPGVYRMSDANEVNVFLSNGSTNYIVKCADLIDKHELVSPYLHNYESLDVDLAA